WAFGDGATGSGATPSHAYANPGTYTATLTVTDNLGANNADTTSVVISNTNTTWGRSIGSTDSDAAYAVAIDAAGNTIVGGAYRGSVNFGNRSYTSAGGADWFIAKYSPTGAPLWANSMGGPSDDFLDALTLDANGDVIVSGRIAGTANFGGAPLV